jgi:cell division protein FtsN
MKNKDFREIQVSSSLLVVIFLGVLALGVFIFLLGVSVGKKQAGVAAPTQIVTQQIPEPVKEPPVKPAASETAAENPSDAGALPAASGSAPPATEVPAPKPGPKETTTTKPPASKPATETKKTASGLYYVQVGAFTDRTQAQAAADRYKKQGYTAVVANPKPADTKTWYRVRLGGYASRDRAVDLLAKLNAAAGKKTDFRIVQD